MIKHSMINKKKYINIHKSLNKKRLSSILLSDNIGNQTCPSIERITSIAFTFNIVFKQVASLFIV